MPRILVSPLSAIHAVLREHRPSHMVTLLSPEHMIDTPDGFESARHLRLGVNDIVDVAAGTHPPAARHIEELLDFAQGWTRHDHGDAPMLVHCWAGVSRSMAAAYAVLCDHAGPGHETRLAGLIRDRAPHAAPNALLVAHADAHLRRGGAMIAAVAALSRPVPVEQGHLVMLDAP